MPGTREARAAEDASTIACRQALTTALFLVFALSNSLFLLLTLLFQIILPSSSVLILVFALTQHAVNTHLLLHSPPPPSSFSSYSVLFLVFPFALDAVDADLLVIFLQRGQIFARLGELTLLHAFAHVPRGETKEGGEG